MKEKKPIYKRVWFIVLVVFIVLGVISSLGDSEEKGETNKSENNSASNDNNEGANSKEKETSKQYRVGEVVKVGDVDYIVNSVTTSKTVGGQYLSETARGTYLIINLTVTNNGNDSLTVSSSLFKLLNGEKEYESDSGAGIYANEDAGFFFEDLNPDLSLTGNVVFDVTDEVIASPDLQLQVQTGFWGTETEVILLNG